MDDHKEVLAALIRPALVEANALWARCPEQWTADLVDKLAWCLNQVTDYPEDES